MNLLLWMEKLNGLMEAIIANNYISLQKINLVPNSQIIQIVTIPFTYANYINCNKPLNIFQFR